MSDQTCTVVLDIRPANSGHAGHVAFCQPAWVPRIDARRGKRLGAIVPFDDW
jgi:hypothetical protein